MKKRHILPVCSVVSIWKQHIPAIVKPYRFLNLYPELENLHNETMNFHKS